MALRSLSGMSLMLVAALLLPLIVTTFENPLQFAPHLCVALVTVLFWEGSFAILRRKSVSFHGINTALIVCVLIPRDLTLWQLVFSLSLGVVLGELVFGGRGFSFLNAATVSLSLLVFSFPQVELAAPSQNLALATLPGAVMLLAFGLISSRVLIGCVLGAAAVLASSSYQIDAVSTLTALAFGLVFLTADPLTAAATNPGRWFYGAFAGGLIVLLSQGPTLNTEAVVFGSLIASIFAPLIDHLVVLTHARRRRVRHV